jgi:hypothetical protein
LDIADEIPCIVVRDSDEEYVPLSLAEIIFEQQRDEYCQEVLNQKNMSRAEHYIDERGIALHTDPKPGRVQVFIPKALREHTMKLAHYPK